MKYTLILAIFLSASSFAAREFSKYAMHCTGNPKVLSSTTCSIEIVIRSKQHPELKKVIRESIDFPAPIALKLKDVITDVITTKKSDHGIIDQVSGK